MKLHTGGRVRSLLCLFLAFGVSLSVAGCKKSGLPQPDFPLQRQIIASALEQTGLPWAIADSETTSSAENHLAYTLRDPENKKLTGAISSAITEGERFLQVSSISYPALVNGETPAFAWESWKQQLIFAALLYGGFEDEEEVYRAFSGMTMPEGDGQFLYATLSGTFCRVSHISSKIGDSTHETLTVFFYESESLYKKTHQKIIDRKAELDRARSEA